MKPQMNADGRRYILIKNTHHQILNPISYILTPELDTDFHRYQLIEIN